MSRQQRLILVVSILASFVAFLDSSVVNVALPAISRNLGGGLSTQQWTVDAYLITLGSLILLAGSLSDLFGRRRVLSAGLIGFAATSIMCAVAPDSTFLILARGLQGVAGALLVPSSLAMIISAFSGSAQGKAIGTWTAWTGISFIVGPLLGGTLVDTVSWRLIFAINIAPIVICLWLLRSVEHGEQVQRSKVDAIGAVLCSVGLFALVFGLIEQPHLGWHSLITVGSILAGFLLIAAFVFFESRNPIAMLPLSLFKVRNFRVGNIATLGIYSGLSIVTFLVVVFLQQAYSYSALGAGMALLPVTIIMFLLSPRFGRLAGKFGPRIFMACGPIIAALGFLFMLRVDGNLHYWSQLFPGIIAFGLGLSITVAPLTSAVLGDIEPKRAGIASAVNNAVARIAGLVAIALIGVITGSRIDLSGFHRALIVTAFLLMSGGIVSALGIRNRKSV